VGDPQVAQAEGGRQELEADRGVVELAADAFDGHAQDFGVIEGKRQD
jgi:hypothetical protein